MNIKDYIQFLFEQDEIVPFPKRKGEYVIVGDKNKLLAKAIEEKKIISFIYDGPRRPKKKSVLPGKRQKVYPVALGSNKKGNMVVRCWIEPPTISKTGYNKKSASDIPNWRTFKVSGIRDIKFFDETFDLNRLTGYNQSGDDSMSIVYKSAKISTQSTPKPTTTPKKVSTPTPTPKVKPTSTLPQPKPETKPSLEPQKKSLTNQDKGQEKPENKLNEELIRIKTLMSTIKTL